MGLKQFIIAVILVLLLASCATYVQKYNVYLPMISKNHVPPQFTPVSTPTTRRPEKKGLSTACYPNKDSLKSNLADTKSTWYYNWRSNPYPVPGVETIPMIWDETHVYDSVTSDSKYILGFNEPDWPGQAELTPQDAVDPWNILETRFKDKTLVSIVTSDQNPWWLRDFRNLYYDKYGYYPRFDVLALHCYQRTAPPCIEYVKSQVKQAKEWGIPEVWVTEFGIYGDFINGTKQFVWYLNDEPYVTRYAIFSNQTWCMNDPFWFSFALYNQNGLITELGTTYKNLP